MNALYESARHEPLQAGARNEASARAALQRIVDATIAAFDPATNLFAER